MKSVGFLKGAIQGGSLKDSCRHWQEEVSGALKAHLEGGGDVTITDTNQDMVRDGQGEVGGGRFRG